MVQRGDSQTRRFISSPIASPQERQSEKTRASLCSTYKMLINVCSYVDTFTEAVDLICSFPSLEILVSRNLPPLHPSHSPGLCPARVNPKECDGIRDRYPLANPQSTSRRIHVSHSVYPPGSSRQLPTGQIGSCCNATLAVVTAGSKN